MCAGSSDLYEWEVADAAMHLEIISIFDNDRINRIYKNNLSEFIRIGQYSVKNGMHIPQTNANLRNMVRYMREENFEKSYDILRTLHLESGMDNALKGR